MALSYTRPMAADGAVGSFGGRANDNPNGWAWPGIPPIAGDPERAGEWRACLPAAFLQTYAGLRSHLYIAHVRDKTIGADPVHADTRPFGRELLGRDAANDLVRRAPPGASPRCWPPCR
jgi:glutamine amidotransferase class II-like protein